LQFNSSLKILTSLSNFRFFKPIHWLLLKKLTEHYILVLFTFIHTITLKKWPLFYLWFVEFSVLSQESRSNSHFWS
jgi:hypothetical protein